MIVLSRGFVIMSSMSQIYLGEKKGNNKKEKRK
jgi:hypothetical protein